MTRRTTGALTAAAAATLVACTLTPAAAFADTTDTTRPSLSIDSPTAGSAFRPANVGSVELSASDNVGLTSVAVNLYDAGNSQLLKNLGSASKIGGDRSWNGSFALPKTLEPGVYTLRASAKDVSGLSQTATLTFTIDVTRPVLSIDTPDEESVFRSAYVGSVMLSATDTVGLESVAANLYDAANSTMVKNLGSAKIAGGTTWSGSFALPTNLAEGVYTVRASLKDLAGNSHTVTRRFTVDNTRPVLSIDTPTEGSTFKPANVGSVALSATDNAGLASVGVNLYDAANSTMVKNLGSAKIGGTTSWNDAFTLPTGLADGVYTIRASVKDLAGLSHTVTRQLTVDTAKPGVSASLSEDGTTVLVEGTDNHGLNYLAANVYGADGTLLTPQTSPRGLGVTSYAHTFALPTDYAPGDYTIKAGAEDAAGNVTVVVLNFAVAEQTGEVEGPGAPVVIEPENPGSGSGENGESGTGDEGGDVDDTLPVEQADDSGETDGSGEGAGGDEPQLGDSGPAAENAGTQGGNSTPAATTSTPVARAATAAERTAELASTGAEIAAPVAAGGIALLLGALAMAVAALRGRRAQG
ncbi:hypothetical protein FLP10_11180 [Agromyces intestinalis]|uniref:Ig-like domain-containing protein n=1 Tax=Agromyces intestinalis TaxID=2592652 RepID=A0A5C1YFP5_9MICO|nr:Ig-like domain-containing protein [Agromyces intestinalis]QEO14914.1 hypothetical protein FLP10_11180 [Agromyces intestinalis]